MIHRVSRRGVIRLATLALALITTLGALNIVQARQAGRYKAAISNNNQRAFMELASMMSNISSSLDKGVYATSASQLSLLSATLWRESEAAKTSLSALPADGEPPEKLYRFLSQVGDYAMAMSRKVSGGKTLSEDELKNLLALAKYSHTLGEQMAALERDVTVGGLDIDALERDLNENGAPSLSDGFNEMEQSFEGYPKLIYDGPFSDNMLERKPLVTTGKPEVSAERALATACKMTSREKNELTALIPTTALANGFVNRISDLSDTSVRSRQIRSIETSAAATVGRPASRCLSPTNFGMKKTDSRRIDNERTAIRVFDIS